MRSATCTGAQICWRAFLKRLTPTLRAVQRRTPLKCCWVTTSIEVRNRARFWSHRRFLVNLKSSFACGDYFFAHAGIRPRVPFSEQKEQDLLWIREDFLLHEESFGKFIIHGHTPVMEP